MGVPYVPIFLDGQPFILCSFFMLEKLNKVSHRGLYTHPEYLFSEMYTLSSFVPFSSFEMKIMDPHVFRVCFDELVLMNTNLTGQSMKYVLKAFFFLFFSP